VLWTGVLAFFGILTGVSLYLAVEGQASCGCFGKVEVSPWWTLALDVGILAILLVSRPRDQGTARALTGWRREFLRTAGAALGFVVVLGGGFLLLNENPQAALAQMRGEPLTVEPAVTDIGSAIRGTRQAFPVELRNHADHPIRVVGGTTSCSCITTTDLPLVIPPGENRTLQVTITFKGSAGRFQHHFQLFTDQQQQFAVVAGFTGRVLDPPAQ
jgi:hypothetical protein